MFQLLTIARTRSMTKGADRCLHESPAKFMANASKPGKYRCLKRERADGGADFDGGEEEQSPAALITLPRLCALDADTRKARERRIQATVLSNQRQPDQAAGEGARMATQPGGHRQRRQRHRRNLVVGVCRGLEKHVGLGPDHHRNHGREAAGRHVALPTPARSTSDMK